MLKLLHAHDVPQCLRAPICFFSSDRCTSDRHVSAVLIFVAFWALFFNLAQLRVPACTCIRPGHPPLYMYCLHLHRFERLEGLIKHARSWH